MLAADLEALVAAPVFWIKMVVLAGLLANGWSLRRTARRLATGGVHPALGKRRLGRLALASIALWFAALAFGAALPAA
jgi:hypothetical protein